MVFIKLKKIVMFKMLPILVLISLIASGCSILGTDDNHADVLIPLEIGNSWRYQVRYNSNEIKYYTVTIADKVTIDSNSYFQLGIRYDSGYVEKNNFIRNTREGAIFLYYIPDRDYKESNFFRYPVEGSATYHYTDVRGFTFEYKVKSVQEEVPAGQFSTYSYSGYDADAGIKIYFAPNVGIVRLEETDANTVLLSYDLK